MTESELTLTPSQDLAMEVLTARWRLGERLWTFDKRHTRVLGQLADLGLVSVIHGIVENTVRASLTEDGIKMYVSDLYVPPVLRKLGGRHKR